VIGILRETVPEVAVTKTVLVVGCVAGVEGLLLHPVRPADIIEMMAIAQSIEMNLNLRRQPSRGKGRSNASKIPADGFRLAFCFTLEIVSEVVADDPSVSVTCAEAKLHVAPAGKPEQVKTTAPPKPHFDET
jgi:hypothetical protein